MELRMNKVKMVTCEELWDYYCSNDFLTLMRINCLPVDIYIRGMLYGDLIILWSWEQWREASFMKRKAEEAFAHLS